MFLKDILRIAQRSIKANRLRARITITIIAIGIMALVGIITAIQGIEDSITSNFSSLGANTFSITQNGMMSNFKKGKRGQKRVVQNKESKKIKYEQALAFKKRFLFPSRVGITSMVSQSAKVKYLNKKTNPNIWHMAIDEDYLQIAELGLVAGRNFNHLEIENGRDLCIIGNTLATTLFGTRVARAVGQTVEIEGRKFTVIGVLESKGASMLDKTDNMAMIGIGSARRHFDVIKNSFVLSIKVPQPSQTEIASSEAEGLMRSIRKLKTDAITDFEVNRNDSLAEMLKDNLKYVTLFGIIIGIITLLGAAVGLMNIMLVAVVERTKEIGLTKALGATSRVIRLQFLYESIIISLLGGIWGIVAGILLGNLVALSAGSPFRVPWLWIAIAVVVCALVGMISGIYPAIRASKLNPIAALRYE
jgi:putative ABC transport system permease protein